jgi:hypothetical protein
MIALALQLPPVVPIHYSPMELVIEPQHRLSNKAFFSSAFTSSISSNIQNQNSLLLSDVVQVQELSSEENIPNPQTKQGDSVEGQLYATLTRDITENSKLYKTDLVERVLDANTIKLQKTGLVSLAAVQTPQTGGFPECTTTSPSKQIRQLLPAKSEVRVRIIEESSNNVKRVLLIKHSGAQGNTGSLVPVLVNSELVKAGYARPVSRARPATEQALPGIVHTLDELQQSAK